MVCSNTETVTLAWPTIFSYKLQFLHGNEACVLFSANKPTLGQNRQSRIWPPQGRSELGL